MPNYLNVICDIKIMLATKSHSALAILDIPILQGTMKDLGSLFFCSKDLEIIALQ